MSHELNWCLSLLEFETPELLAIRLLRDIVSPEYGCLYFCVGTCVLLVECYISLLGSSCQLQCKVECPARVQYLVCLHDSLKSREIRLYVVLLRQAGKVEVAVVLCLCFDRCCSLLLELLQLNCHRPDSTLRVLLIPTSFLCAFLHQRFQEGNYTC